MSVAGRFRDPVTFLTLPFSVSIMLNAAACWASTIIIPKDLQCLRRGLIGSNMTSVVRVNTEPTIELFFAFVDGAYDYVCAECTALCCKGHGFGGSLKRKCVRSSSAYPQLETMALSRNGDQITFATTAGGCIMLDTDNFCRIEKELGKDKKPNICNLFPFNSFTQVGKTIVVLPHFLCPLRASVAGPARTGSGDSCIGRSRNPAKPHAHPRLRQKHGSGGSSAPVSDGR